MNIDNKTAPYAALLLRVALGIMFLAHGAYLKVFVFTLPGTAQFFGSLGLPEFTAYLTVIGETVIGIALILGIHTRYAAAASIPILLGASWVHIGNGWLFSAQGGGWEYPVFLVVAALVQALLGDGAHALRTSRVPNLAAAR
jgi:putative oxidoreductase